MRALKFHVSLISIGLIVFNVCNADKLEKVAKSDSNIGHFWQFTDFHLEPNFNEKCKGKLGDYKCDSPISLVKSAIQKAKSVEPDPDFVLWSGDAGPHRNTTQKELLQIISNITIELSTSFPSVKMIPLIGNHDTSPANRMSFNSTDKNRSQWCSELAKLWNNSFANEDERQRFSDKCFHSMPIKDKNNKTKLKVLALNGLVWYSNNPLAEPEQDDEVYDPLGQFDWMEANFEEARKGGYKVILASHFPIGASENTPLEYKHLYPKANKKLIDLLVQYSDVITAFLAAHEHTDSFRVIYNNNKPQGVVFLAPSVTPFHLRGLGSTNPRFRIYLYNKASGALSNYEQFKLDLSLENSSWTEDYEACKVYGLTNLSPQQMHSLLDSFAHSNQYWSPYYARELGGFVHENWATCEGLNDACRCNHLCAMKHLRYDELDKCLQSGPCVRAEVPDEPVAVKKEPSSGTSTLVYVFVSLFLLGVLLMAIALFLKDWLPRRRNVASGQYMGLKTEDSSI